MKKKRMKIKRIIILMVGLATVLLDASTIIRIDENNSMDEGNYSTNSDYEYGDKYQISE